MNEQNGANRQETAVGTLPYWPKVSIVIPAYNASNYLAEAIDSALAQTYPNTEIIVVNDGSKDDGATERIALSYGNKIRYFRKENGGSSSALNTGIANMTGEWFSWLSHDDLYVPDKVETQVVYLNSLDLTEEKIYRQVLFSASDLIDGEGRLIRKAEEKESLLMQKQVKELPGNQYLVAEPTKYTFHGCSCLVHKRVFEEIGAFDEALRLLNDRDMWYRVYVSGYQVHFLPKALAQGRIHAKQVSKSIGYSYHNPEQDMFWKRSLDWLLENHADEKQLFFLFGRNAYLKTRNVDGDRAFAHVAEIAPREKVKLRFLKTVYKCRAAIRAFAKKVYLKIKT